MTLSLLFLSLLIS